MSFKFNWPCFDLKFYEITRNELEKSLNKGKKPANICDDISVKELDMGSIVSNFLLYRRLNWKY